MIWDLSDTRRRAVGVCRRCSFAAGALVIAILAGVPAIAAEYSIARGQKVIGEQRPYAIQQGDVFPDIARRFDIGYTALVAANPGVDPWVPGLGRRITIPSLFILPDAPQQGIVINLAQWRLFYFPPGGGRVETYPLGLGTIGQRTPIGATRVVRKDPNPAWYPPASIRAEKPELPAIVPPGPDNPLGAYALRLGWPTYLIHGTNKPDGVGRNVSHGCIRLYPEDIAKLFAAVAVGTPVRTVEQQATAGWIDDGLYVQIYPSKSQTEEIDIDQPATPEAAEGVRELVSAAAGAYVETVDWLAVEEARNQRSGMPVRVATRFSVIDSGRPYVRETPYYDRGPTRAVEREESETSVPYDERGAQWTDGPEPGDANIPPKRKGTSARQRAVFQKLLDGLTNRRDSSEHQ